MDAVFPASFQPLLSWLGQQQAQAPLQEFRPIHLPDTGVIPTPSFETLALKPSFFSTQNRSNVICPHITEHRVNTQIFLLGPAGVCSAYGCSSINKTRQTPMKRIQTLSGPRTALWGSGEGSGYGAAATRAGIDLAEVFSGLIKEL